MDEIKLFVERVRKMRTAQKNYFRTRYTEYLRESKQLEKLVDEMCDKYVKDGRNEPRQLDLGL